MAAYTTLPAGTRTGSAGPVRIDAAPASVARLLGGSLAFAAAYLALDAVGSSFLIPPVPVKAWNPQAGLTLALACIGGMRYAPALVAAAWLSEALLRHAGQPMLQAMLALATTAPLLAAGLAVRWRTHAQGLNGVAALRDLLLIGAAGAALSAALYVASYAFATPEPTPALLTSVLLKGLSDYAGIVAVTPLVVLLLAPRPPVLPARAPVWLDAALFALLMGMVIALVVAIEPQTGERLLYLLFVPLIVVAMRRGYTGAAIGITVVQAAIMLAMGLSGRSAEDAAAVQLLLLVLGITTLVLGSVASERRRAQSELARRSDELLAQQRALSDAMRVSAASETASTLAHELSQPLSAIGSYAHALQERLRRGLCAPQELLGITERIVAESARTRESLQRIRDFFRSSTFTREPVSLEPLVVDVVDALRDRMSPNAIAITIDVEPELAPVHVDRVQLHVVIHNLVGNALDAALLAPPPRWVTITARARGTIVEVDVADSGPGIDPTLSDSLFEPLATTKPAGMGLGLPISRTLVQAHGGTLILASVHPTTFRFTLPTHG